MILGEEMMRNKIDYIHQNPVKRGFVDEPCIGVTAAREIIREWTDLLMWIWIGFSW
jgi:hypothetical protein